MTDIVSPPTIDAMPPAPQPTDTREQFNQKAFPHAAAQQTLVTQTNASAAATNQNAIAANERAMAAGAARSGHPAGRRGDGLPQSSQQRSHRGRGSPGTKR